MRRDKETGLPVVGNKRDGETLLCKACQTMPIEPGSELEDWEYCRYHKPVRCAHSKCTKKVFDGETLCPKHRTA